MASFQCLFGSYRLSLSLGYYAARANEILVHVGCYCVVEKNCFMASRTPIEFLWLLVEVAQGNRRFTALED